MTDEDLRRAEDEQFNKSRWMLRLFASLPRKMREGLVPLRRRTPTTGRPSGSSIELTHLEAAVDALRRDRVRLSKAAVARGVPCSESALYAWLGDHPDAWDALVVRYRTGR